MFRAVKNVTREFVHPLCRAARVFEAERQDAPGERVLVIVTTMELDPTSPRYKKNLVEKLSYAAKGYLSKSSDATSYVLVNRLRNWDQ